jgi:hypothetical protein
MPLKRRLASPWLMLALLCVNAQYALAAGKPQAPSAPTQGWCGKFNVMTRNMCVGADFAEISRSERADPARRGGRGIRRRPS